MNNFFKTNIKKLIISSLVILSPIIFGLVMWNKLPELMSIHLGFSGIDNGNQNRGLVVFALPIIMLSIHWICMFVTAFDKSNINQNKKAFGIIFWIIPLLSLYICSMIYAFSLGAEFNIISTLFAFMGMLFLIIGNYMPKCKQNSTLGIKISYTLANEENWNVTHRLAGKVWAIGGALIIVLSFLPFEISAIVFFPIVLLLVLIPTVYSANYFKKQLADGRADKSEIKKIGSKYSKLSKIVAVIILLSVLAFVFLVGKLEFRFDETSFTIDADVYNDLTINYSDITNIEHRETDSKGMRMFGYGSSRLLMGTFKNDEFGEFTRYSYTKCTSCVVLTIDKSILVISGADESETLDIYNTLIEKCN